MDCEDYNDKSFFLFHAESPSLQQGGGVVLSNSPKHGLLNVVIRVVVEFVGAVESVGVEQDLVGIDPDLQRLTLLVGASVELWGVMEVVPSRHLQRVVRLVALALDDLQQREYGTRLVPIRHRKNRNLVAEEEPLTEEE